METERIYLKEFELERDIAFHLELMNTEKWIKYIGDRNIHHEKDFREYYQLNRLKTVQNDFKNYVIYLQENNIKIGTCGLFKRDGLLFADIGYALLPLYEGFGYVLDAAQLVIKDYFKHKKQEKILAFTAIGNIASQKSLLKLGFVKIDERIVSTYTDKSAYFELLNPY